MTWIELVNLTVSSVCRCEPPAVSVAGATGGPLVFCPRCSGVYTGFLIGLVCMASWGREQRDLPPRPLFALNLSFLALMALTGFGSLYGLIELSPPFKFLVGGLFGSALAILVAPVFSVYVRRRPLRPWRRPDVLRYAALPAALILLSLIQRAPWRVARFLVSLLALFGFGAAFLLVNAAMTAWVARRWIPRFAAAWAIILAFPLATAELLLLTLWRIAWAS